MAIALQLSATASAQDAGPSSICSPGLVITADTSGHCCWPGQAWSLSRAVCVGMPQCPAGLAAKGETCAPPECTSGQVANADTAGHCCWPGQAWSQTRSLCVGIPQCPAGLVAESESCTASKLAPPNGVGGPPAPPDVSAPASAPPTIAKPLDRSSVDFYIGGGFLGAVSSPPTLYVVGGTLDSGVSALVGFQPHFPDREGGKWHGVEIRALVGTCGAGVIYDKGNATGLFAVSGTIEVGYEFLRFKRLDLDYLKQEGLGVFIGPRAGLQYSLMGGAGGADPTVGAVAALVVPTFNAEHRQLRRAMFEVSAWTLPGTGLTFLTIGGGGAL